MTTWIAYLIIAAALAGTIVSMPAQIRYFAIHPSNPNPWSIESEDEE